MCGEPFRRALLVVPTKPSGAVSRELHVIRRIGIDEIFRLDLKRLKITIGERPVLKDTAKLRKVGRISDRLVRSKGDIKLTVLIKPAKTIEAGAIQVIEKLCSFCTSPVAIRDQFVKPLTMPVEDVFRVLH